MKLAAALALLLCGCGHAHTRVDVGAASPQAAVHAHIESGRGLAVLLGLSFLAAGVSESERTETRYVPELDPTRKVSEQDCTKPLDYSLGNIRCK